MTVKMMVRETPGGSATEIDLTSDTYKAEGFALTVSYNAPARLTWSCRVAQHLKPIPEGSFIIFWDDVGGTYDGENPLFVGYVETPVPGNATREVLYTAYDPTYRAGKDVTLFDAAWESGSPPVPADDSVPRLIYNVRITADPDYSYQVGADGTVGDIIAGILEYCKEALVYLDFSSSGAGPYDGSDLSAMTMKPQEKLEFQSESVRSAIDRVQKYEPRFKMLFDPVSRLLRFRNLLDAGTVTINLNSATEEHAVYALSIQPSTETCITAISIYGPPAPVTDTFVWHKTEDPEDPPDNDLQTVGDPFVFETYNTSEGEADAEMWQEFQIINEADRRGAKLLETEYTYQKTPLLFGVTNTPLLLCSWDGGTSWMEWTSVAFNHLTGSFRFIGNPPMFYFDPPPVPNSTQKYFPPNALKLIWAPYGPPLKVRVPSSGHEGTANTVAGLEREKHQYDESLMVGREYGIPVTTEARQEQFEEYGQTILDQRKDIVWTGAASLNGLDWRFLRLNKRLRFAVGDGDGGTLTTGWEDVDAHVTEVTYNFADRMTQLVFSSDQLSLMGIDPEMLKMRLGIKALEQRTVYDTRRLFRPWVSANGYRSMEVAGIITTQRFEYVDPQTGQVQS